jgi:hypothetical protein
MCAGTLTESDIRCVIGLLYELELFGLFHFDLLAEHAICQGFIPAIGAVASNPSLALLLRHYPCHPSNPERSSVLFGFTAEGQASLMAERSLVIIAGITLEREIQKNVAQQIPDFASYAHNIWGSHDVSLGPAVDFADAVAQLNGYGVHVLECWLDECVVPQLLACGAPITLHLYTLVCSLIIIRIHSLSTAMLAIR